MSNRAITEQNERLDSFIAELKRDRPSRPERRPAMLAVASLLLGAASLLWLVQWWWIPLHRDVAFTSGAFVNGYTAGNGIAIFVILLTVEALVMCVLTTVLAVGVYRRSTMARAMALVGAVLVALEMFFRVPAAPTQWERTTFTALAAAMLLAAACLLTPAVRHYFDWRVGSPAGRGGVTRAR